MLCNGNVPHANSSINFKKDYFCKNLFQTPKSNKNEGNDFENDEIQMEVCCPSGKEIPEQLPIYECFFSV
jgi:hypothetical protein